jgi:uncharacterized protein
MNPASTIDWSALWQAATARFALGASSIHGPDHWRRVERYGVHVAEHCGGDIVLVRLFAVLHDVCRASDGTDAEHGARAAALAERWRGRYFELSDDDFIRLHYAFTWHTFGRVSDDPTVGACWDADRLDIWRAGYTPHAKYLSTARARQLARTGQVGPDYVP